MRWLVLFFLSPFLSFGFNLTGTAEWALNQKVILEQYQEYFLYTSKKIDEQIIDANGKFNFQISAGEIFKYRIIIGDKVGELYLEPTAQYNIAIRPYNGPEAPILSKEKIVGLEIEKDGALSINNKIEEYNLQFDQFIQTNAAAIVQKRANSIIQTFKEKLNEKLISEPSPFVVNYVKYSMAQLEMTTNYSRQEMMDEYIKGAPVLFYNPQYATFFNNMFTEFIRFFAANEISTQLNKSVNFFQSVDSLKNVFETNIYFRQLNDQQKELLIINELYFQKDNNRFKKQSINRMLDDMAEDTKFEDHKLLLTEMLKKFEMLNPNTLAPNFYFTDFEGNKKSLADLKGKYVYLDFWASWCRPCIEEMQVMNDLYPKYKDQIEFLSISIDERASRAQRFYKKNNYPWMFGHVAVNEVKDLYDVRIIPMYYLIDPEGFLVKSPAARPTGEIERVFYNIKKNALQQNTKDLPSWKIKPGKK